MPDIKVLICNPTSSKGYVVPGSLPDKCSKCGQPVWVSPSSWLIIQPLPTLPHAGQAISAKTSGIAILCTPCALDQMEKAEHPKIEDITPAQAEEIEEYLKQEGKE